jgi:riboflavin kinase/FMN adenylyltransferase
VILLDEPGLPAGPLLRGGAVALGFFDGCHSGHQRILDLCREKGGGAGKAGVLTFRDHPGSAIPGRQPPRLLTTTEERIELLQARGLTVYLKTFDREFSTWTAERFCEELLARRLGVAEVIVGHDYRFGHRAAGDVELLASLGQTLGFATTVVPAVTLEADGRLIISSTKIRQAIAEGDFELAQSLLGRPYSVKAVVLEGQKKGRTIDFPTANLEFPPGLLHPPHGVMAVQVTAAGERYGGVANFGLRPTVEDGATRPLLEAHLFDFSGDLYGQTLKVDMLRFLRSEQKFDSFAALRDQILADARQARQILSEPLSGPASL